MGIFKSITKALKKAAPVIGAGIGMYFGGPMGSAALGGALGGGIGSLVGGGDADDALKAALLGGIGGYASAGGNFTTAGQAASNASNVASAPSVTGIESVSANTGVSDFAIDPSITAFKQTAEPSIFDKALGFAKENPYLTATGVGSLGLLGSYEEPEPIGKKMRDYPEGEYRGGKLTTLDDDGNLVHFDGGDPEQRKAYYDQLRRNQSRKKEVVTDDDEYGMFTASEGGVAEMNRIVQDPNDTRNFAEKMTTGKLKFNTKAGKEGYNELDLRTIQAELAKRRAPKTSMIAPYMGDPSQLMRNFMVGGEVEGPGTGTSDSVPARLSDGEFVVTAKAVRGAGGGDRNVGAARMYDMMSQLERVA